MKLVFCGTPKFAVPTLQALIAAGHEVALVLAQPDKPVGRDAQVNPVPVKQEALAHGICVEQPVALRHNVALQQTLQGIAPDAIIVVAYGRILPQWMLDLPPYGCLNGHASLLPRWRGAAPIQWAIASGDNETGCTTMRLDAGLDTGAMLLKRRVPITSVTTSPDLFDTLSCLSADLMIETLRRLEEGSVTPEPQDSSLATLAPILTRADGRIDWRHSAQCIDERFRGFQPWPGAFTTLRGKKLIAHAMTRTGLIASRAEPGTIEMDGEAMRITCGKGSTLVLDEVQMEGKKRMSAAEFVRGFHIRDGERLG